MNSTLMITQTQKTYSQTPEQGDFYRLQKKIENLHKKKKKREKELNECLQYYFKYIRPQQELFRNNDMEHVRRLYVFYQEKKGLSKREFKVLKEIISSQLTLIMNGTHYSNVSEDLKQMFRELEGVDYEEIQIEAFDALKNEMSELFKEKGLDIDFSKFNMSDSEDDVMQKMRESIIEAMSDGESVFQKKTTTKKERERERKQREIEEMRRKTIGSVYKQLAKVFHPDLELDPTRKIHKEELMKKITVAYEDNDLYTLLAIEAEWMESSNNKSTSLNYKGVSSYNTIFKEQIKIMEREIQSMILQPSYMELNRFFCGEFTGLATLKRFYTDLQSLSNRRQNETELLVTPEAKNIIKRLIQEFTYLNF